MEMPFLRAQQQLGVQQSEEAQGMIEDEAGTVGL